MTKVAGHFSHVQGPEFNPQYYTPRKRIESTEYSFPVRQLLSFRIKFSKNISQGNKISRLIITIIHVLQAFNIPK
jgi:hypothetical protein